MSLLLPQPLSRHLRCAQIQPPNPVPLDGLYVERGHPCSHETMKEHKSPCPVTLQDRNTLRGRRPQEYEDRPVRYGQKPRAGKGRSFLSGASERTAGLVLTSGLRSQESRLLLLCPICDPIASATVGPFVLTALHLLLPLQTSN